MRNRYGVDVDYYRKEFRSLSDTLSNQTLDGLHDRLLGLAKAVQICSCHKCPDMKEKGFKYCGNCGKEIDITNTGGKDETLGLTLWLIAHDSI